MTDDEMGVLVCGSLRAAREAARLGYLHKELVTAARNYYARSDLTHFDRESLLAAKRMGDLLDAFDNRKDPSQ